MVNFMNSLHVRQSIRDAVDANFVRYIIVNDKLVADIFLFYALFEYEVVVKYLILYYLDYIFIINCTFNTGVERDHASLLGLDEVRRPDLVQLLGKVPSLGEVEYFAVANLSGDTFRYGVESWCIVTRTGTLGWA